MQGRNITNPHYQFILVQCVLTKAHILEDLTMAYFPPPDSYQRL